VQLAEQASQSTPGSSGSAQKTKTAWDKVKDVVRRGSTEVPAVVAAAAAERAAVEGRSSSAERYRTANDDEADPWVEKRPRSKHDGTAPDRDDRVERSSESPPRSFQRQDRKRFSVSQATSASVARSTLSNSPLDLAGLLGMSSSCSSYIE